MNYDCERIQIALKNNKPLVINNDLALHFSGCPDCMTLFDSQQGVKPFLQRALANSDVASAALRARIRRDLHQPQPVWQRLRAWFDGLNRGWMIAAATAILLVTGGMSLARKQQWFGTNDTVSFNRSASVTEHNAQILKIGFANHQHCAVARDYSAGPHSFAQMAEAMGDDWIDLVALTKEHVPAHYRVMIAHHCKLGGRQFIHLILSNQHSLLSLALTRKNGEAFDAQQAIAQIANVVLHQMREQNYSVAGFETSAYLGYVVSGLAAEENMQLVLRLAPAVKAFVMQRES